MFVDPDLEELAIHEAAKILFIKHYVEHKNVTCEYASSFWEKSTNDSHNNKCSLLYGWSSSICNRCLIDDWMEKIRLAWNTHKSFLKEPKLMSSLLEHMKNSQENPFLKIGPPAFEDWIYRDFSAMPQVIWLELLDLLGEENIRIIASNTRQLPPAPMCRAQMWINPEAQKRWNNYLKENVQ